MARVATWLPLIPVAVLVILLVKTWSGLNRPELFSRMLPADADLSLRLTEWQVIGFLCTYIVGFFATAGAAGVDVAANARNQDDVHIGGLTGIVLPAVLAGEATILIVAGAYGTGLIQPGHPATSIRSI